MSFLAPAFLAGLGLLAVPVIIHLTQRQRSEVTAFPSLMFLRKVPFRTSNRRRIRHPLLFALRCLAIVLLAAAFARPFFPREAAAGGAGARDVVLLIDTSASLGYAGRWDEALDEARAVVDGLAEGDRVAIVGFDERAREALPLTADPAAVSGGLDRLEPSDRGTRLESGLQLAGRILDQSERERREVVLISDFQRTGWEDEGRARLPDGVALTTRTLAEGDEANVAVADARLAGDESGRVRVIARIANMGDRALEAFPVSLDLGGRSVGTRPIDLEPRGAATVAFDDVPLPGGRTRARVTIPGDELAIDDELRFVASPDPGLEVLILEGSRGRQDRSLFLERALAIGEAPRLRPVRRPAGQLDAAWLRTAAAVVLNDANLTGGGGAQRLYDWVEAGGALVVVAGPNTAPEQWAGPAPDLLGGEVGGTEDRTGSGGVRLAWLDYDHPIFELFATPRSGDFSSARFFRFRGYEPGSGARVVARFEDGEPALVEHGVGEGRVLIWLSTLDRFWNDLALQPVFLPFLHRTVLHATRYRSPERWIETGGVLELGALVGTEAGPADDGREWVLVNPDGDREAIEVAEGPTWIEFGRAGFYQVEPREGGEPSVPVAVNAPLAESDLAAIAPERVDEAVRGADEADAAAVVEPGPGGEEAPARSELWWPLLLAAAVVLAAESVIANRWTRRRPRSGLVESA